MDGCSLTREPAAHLIEEVSHASQTTESKILFYSSRCIASSGQKCVFDIFWRTPQIDSTLCEQQRSSCPDFKYNFVQYKRKTTTLIPISLRCNPLSSKFCLQGLIFLIAPFLLFSSWRFVSLFTSCQYWESSSVSQESHLCTGRGQHDAPPL